MIVDAWIQHPTPAFLRHPRFASLRRWVRAGEAPKEIPLERTLAALDSAGVTRALVTAWWGPEGPIIDNDTVAQWVRRAPDRLVGIASVDLSRPMDAVRELRRTVRQLGMRGLRVLPWLWERPPNHRWYYPLYAECIELGVPFCLQVGHTGPLGPSEPGRPIPYLDEVALDFPDLTIVAGHIGYPWTEEMIALATKYPNVFIDTSAYKPKRYPPALCAYLREHGRRKVLFGSNYPMIQPADCLAEVDSLQLDEEARRLFLGENAVRVFGLDVWTVQRGGQANKPSGAGQDLGWLYFARRSRAAAAQDRGSSLAREDDGWWSRSGCAGKPQAAWRRVVARLGKKRAVSFLSRCGCLVAVRSRVVQRRRKGAGSLPTGFGCNGKKRLDTCPARR